MLPIERNHVSAFLFGLALIGIAATADATPPCGNGIKQGGEQCDDGDTADGDGCSGACQIEAGWTCETAGSSPSVCTRMGTDESSGGGTLTFIPVTEQRAEAPLREPTLEIAPFSSQTVQTLGRCGDGEVQTYRGEECDDANTDETDGCDSQCRRVLIRFPFLRWIPSLEEARTDDLSPERGPVLMEPMKGKPGETPGGTDGTETPATGGPILPPEDASLKLGRSWVIDRVGGPNGTPKVVQCLGNQAVKAIRVRHGGVLDQFVSITCMSLSDLSGEGSTPTVLPVHAGGAGGIEGEAWAARGTAMVGWYQKNSVWNDASLVTELKPLARTVGWHSGDVIPLDPKFGAGNPAAAWFPVLCPAGYVMNGVIAYAGSHVDSLGIVCREITTKRLPLTYQALPAPDFSYPYPVGYEFGPISPVDGGLGGGSFRTECPDGRLVGGLEAHHGGLVDALTVLCFDPSEPDLKASPVGRFGGGGGGPGATYAPRNYAMVGWHSKASPYRTTGGFGFTSDNVLSEFLASYQDLGTKEGPRPAPSTEKFGQGHGSFPWRLHLCPNGFFLTGFKGRAGGYIDALGGICERYPRAESPLIFPVEDVP